MLRFITCGSVDDGKSTLIGKLLWESKQLFSDQLSSLIEESKKYGTQGNEIDFALLVDGLTAEREQGITIDVAYRFFSTPKRKFVVADTPGHEQYTRNMVTGASTASVAIILIDARKGILPQTRRHAFLTSMVGIKHIVLAVNKMDLVNYDLKIFDQIKNDFSHVAKSLQFESITAIPLSALCGDNIVEKSDKMQWYKGVPLLEYLENVELPFLENKKFIFPIQWVNRPNSDFRGFSGTVADGKISVGDEVRVVKSGQLAKISEILTMDGNLSEAFQGNAITIKLDKEIDASRGDVFSASNDPIEMSDQFQVILVWMNEAEGLIGRSYDLKLATQWTNAHIAKILYKINVNTFEHEAATSVQLNDIIVCNVKLSKAIATTAYKDSKTLGSFILVDKFNHSTTAAGMIYHNLRRAQNVHKQNLSVKTSDRHALNGHKGCVVWFTGLSGSGKSTIANRLEVELYEARKHTYILDGDNVRIGLNQDLGFTQTDRIENIRRVAEVAKLMMDAGLIVIVTTISPFSQDRLMAKNIIGKENFLEVYVNTSLEDCETRDPKGLYKKARSGLIPNMTGINSPYELPQNSNLTVESKTEDQINLSVQKIINFLDI